MGLSKLLKQMKAEDWVSEFLDRNERARIEANEYRYPTSNIRPSSSGSPCSRDIQLAMLGFGSPFTEKSSRRVRNGTDAHTRWTADMEEAGLLVEADRRLKVTEPPWSGSIDVVVKRPEANTFHIGELKTANSRGYSRIPAQMEDHTQMAYALFPIVRSYVIQVIQYVDIFQRYADEIGYRVDDECFLLFENTDTQEYKVRYLKPDAKLRAAAFVLGKQAQEACLEGRLIDPPFKPKSRECRACYKESICYAIQDGDEEQLKLVQENLEKLRDNRNATSPELEQYGDIEELDFDF